MFFTPFCAIGRDKGHSGSKMDTFKLKLSPFYMLVEHTANVTQLLIKGG